MLQRSMIHFIMISKPSRFISCKIKEEYYKFYAEMLLHGVIMSKCTYVMCRNKRWVMVI